MFNVTSSSKQPTSFRTERRELYGVLWHPRRRTSGRVKLNSLRSLRWPLGAWRIVVGQRRPQFDHLSLKNVGTIPRRVATKMASLDERTTALISKSRPRAAEEGSDPVKLSSAIFSAVEVGRPPEGQGVIPC